MSAPVDETWRLTWPLFGHGEQHLEKTEAKKELDKVGALQAR